MIKVFFQGTSWSVQGEGEHPAGQLDPLYLPDSVGPLCPVQAGPFSSSSLPQPCPAEHNYPPFDTQP